MHEFTITLKNYRCFDDSHPLQICVRPGFTALVGPNNAGKSTFLKLFYELRDVFNSVCTLENFSHFAKNNSVPANYRGVEHPSEIFCDKNDRDMTIIIDFHITHLDFINKVQINIERNNYREMKASLFIGFYNYIVTGFTAVPNRGNQTWTTFFENDSKTTEVNFKPLLDLKNFFEHIVFIGAFRNAITEGSGNYFDLPIGTAFIEKWNEWRTGSNRNTNIAAQKVADSLAHIFGYNRFEINSANEGKTLQVILDGKPYRLRELGSGLAQFIIVLGYIAMQQPSYILIDEPELNLHPSLQIDFLTSLAAFSKNGVMFATHSIGLARSVAERIYSFRRQDTNIFVKRFEQTSSYGEFLGEMSYSSFKDLGFDKILLVEGVTEVKAVQQFLRLLGKDHTVVIIPLGGSQLIRPGVQTELAELNRISKSIAVLIDSEKTSEESELSKDRADFVEDCQKLGFNVHVTKLRAFENYLTEDAIKKVKGDSYRALQPYEKLKNSSLAWSKEENWRIAREMSKDDLMKTDIGEFLQLL
jgi:AAA15 family ATPase/GTPase